MYPVMTCSMVVMPWPRKQAGARRTNSAQVRHFSSGRISL
jgi:hypothetical protein